MTNIEKYPRVGLTTITRLGQSIKIFVFVLALSLPTAAFAEVMDKEASLGEIWLWACLGAVAGYFATRRHKFLAIVTLPLSLLIPLKTILEIHTPDVGPSIIQEAGMTYVVQAYLALSLVLLAHILGLARKPRRA
jgi:hypothetical protein